MTPSIRSKWGHLRTRFIRQYARIPDHIKAYNAESYAKASKQAPTPEVRKSLMALSHMWANCETTFAAYDVVAANFDIADHDARPMEWGALRAPSIVPTVSALGAVAGGW